MAYVRTAFYLDFDNVFGGLYKLDPEMAVRFAAEPGAWLKRLSTTLSEDGPRRWLILRCYLNPAGWVYHRDDAGDGSRLYFSKFRPSFVRAGFEVVDCPRLGGTKNAADIRIVVDALDALADDSYYEEFVIASGDSDMTPLLQRIRRADRRTMIVSAADAAEAFTAIADTFLDSEQVLALVQGESVDLDDEVPAAAPVEQPAPAAEEPAVGEGYETFRDAVTAEYEKAAEPLNMAALAARLRSQLGGAVAETNWFGFGSFARAVSSLRLPGLRTSQHLIWDETRHEQPAEPVAGTEQLELPEPVDRLAAQLGLPRLPLAWWAPIYQTLADYALGFSFNLTQCTAWTRDRLRDFGFPVSRGAVAFVVRGASFGGRPLHRRPAPTAAEIAEAFVANVLARAEAADLAFTSAETTTVRTWLGAAAE